MSLKMSLKTEVRNTYLRLQRFHEIFYTFYPFMNFCETEQIPTAAIQFTEDGKEIMLLINPLFWGPLTQSERELLICHEMFHVILRHGERLFKDTRYNPRFINVAADITINEFLLKLYFQDRDEVEGLVNQMCLVEKIFDPALGISTKLSSEEYMLLMKEHCVAENLPDSLDSHEYLYKQKSVAGSEVDKLIQKTFEELGGGDLSKEEVQNKLRGEKGAFHKKTLTLNLKKKKQWETVIKNWTRKYLHNHEDDSWLFDSRRLALVKSELSLPSEYDTEKYETNKIDVAFFLDTSGSCVDFAQRFFDAANSLPEEKFDVTLFCYDTTVYEVDPVKKELYGFGGTSFDIIEAYIQKNFDKYPSAVFMITDGLGNNVLPEKPKNWHVFLTPGGSKACFPNKVNFYELEKFE